MAHLAESEALAEESQTISKQPVMVGQPGGSFLRNELARKNPREVINEFQRANAIAVEHCVPLLELLDLHGLKRADTLIDMIQSLRVKLLAKIPTLPYNKMTDLLMETFKYIAIADLRDVPLTIMSRMKSVPEDFLKQFIDSPELYEVCPLDVRRHIWETFKDSFITELRQLFGGYLADATVTNSTSSALETSTTLLRMIGKSGSLLTETLAFIRGEVPLENKPRRVEFYGALRYQLSSGVKAVGLSKSDPAAEFVAILDRAALLSETVDAGAWRELMVLLGRASTEQIFDYQLILRDSVVENAICTQICSKLEACALGYTLPKDDEGITYLLEFYQAAYGQQQLWNAQRFEFGDAQFFILRDFAPAVVSVLVTLHLDENDDHAATTLAGIARDRSVSVRLLGQIAALLLHRGDIPLFLALLKCLRMCTFDEVDFAWHALASALEAAPQSGAVKTALLDGLLADHILLADARSALLECLNILFGRLSTGDLCRLIDAIAKQTVLGSDIRVDYLLRSLLGRMDDITRRGCPETVALLESSLDIQ